MVIVAALVPFAATPARLAVRVERAVVATLTGMAFLDLIKFTSTVHCTCYRNVP
jgi:hypothetical protein